MNLTRLRGVQLVAAMILLFERGLFATPAAEQDSYTAIRTYIDREIAAGHASGVAVALTKNGKIIWEEGFGWADKKQKKRVTPETPFSLASVTKSFTTTALMTLVAAGNVSLDTRANDYLGAARIWSDDGDAAKVTLRHLASHSAGLPGTFMIYPEGGSQKQPSLDDVIRNHAFVVTPPGEQFYYSNVGMGIVAHIVALQSARDFGVYLRDKVLIPLGLTQSFFDTDTARRGEMAQRYDNTGNAFPFYVTSTPGTGELYASAHDVARFAMFHLKDHLADQKSILTDEQIDELHRPIIPVIEDRSYGLGWMNGQAYDGSTVIYHNGNQPGVATVMMLLPSRNIACVVLTNRDGDEDLLEHVRDAMIRTLVPRWTWKTFGPPRPEPLSAAYQGRWRGTLIAGKEVIPIDLMIGDKSATLRVQGRKAHPVSDLGLVNGMFVGKSRGNLQNATGEGRESDLTLRLGLRASNLEGEINLLTPIPHARTPGTLPFWTRLSRQTIRPQDSVNAQ